MTPASQISSSSAPWTGSLPSYTHPQSVHPLHTFNTPHICLLTPILRVYIHFTPSTHHTSAFLHPSSECTSTSHLQHITHRPSYTHHQSVHPLHTFNTSHIGLLTPIIKVYIHFTPSTHHTSAFLHPSSKCTSTSHLQHLSLIHIWRCRRIERCRSRWSPYH